MKIKSSLTDLNGTVYHLTYEDADSFVALGPGRATQSYGVCFLGNKMVIVLNGKKKTWGLVGGSIEEGESYEECLKREVLEESNMRVLVCKPVGYQMVEQQGRGSDYQLRYVCLVEPVGPFISDPAGSITEIKIIDPKDYKQYFDWGEIGDRIIQRALEIKSNLI